VVPVTAVPAITKVLAAGMSTDGHLLSVALLHEGTQPKQWGGAYPLHTREEEREEEEHEEGGGPALEGRHTQQVAGMHRWKQRPKATTPTTPQTTAQQRVESTLNQERMRGCQFWQKRYTKARRKQTSSTASPASNALGVRGSNS